jgi:voltage-gated potassium channel
VFLGAYAWPILDPQLSQSLLFAADLVVRLVLTERRRSFLRENWLDVLTLAVPMLRPVRALRVVVALNVLARRGGEFARGRVVASVVGAVSTVALVSSLAMLDAERGHADANIKTFGDSIWWAAATVTTVGYGDRYPATTQGRFIAAALMISGIALLGVVTAAIASWFVQRMSEVETVERRTGEDVAALAAEVRQLREELRAARETASPDGVAGSAGSSIAPHQPPPLE